MWEMQTSGAPMTVSPSDPGEERSVALAYEISQPTYDSWYRSSRTVAVSFTCGNQRVTYTKNSRSDEITVSDIETL